MQYFIIEHPRRGTFRAFLDSGEPGFSWSASRSDPEKAYRFDTPLKAAGVRAQFPSKVASECKILASPAKKGVGWNEVEPEQLLLPWARIALREMRRRWHRVDVISFDRDKQEMTCNVFRDEDTTNPTWRMVYLKDGQPWHYGQVNGRRGLELPISELNKRDETTEQAARRRRSDVSIRRMNQSRKRNQQRTEVTRPLSLQALFVERQELNDELKGYEFMFIREPNKLQLDQILRIREKLNEVDATIVDLAAEKAERDQQQKMIDMIRAMMPEGA